MFICEISIIIILICRKLRSIGPIQQKIRLPSPNMYIEEKYFIFFWEKHNRCLIDNLVVTQKEISFLTFI